MSIKTKTIRFFTKNKFTSIAIVFLFFVTLWSISSLLQNNSLFGGKNSLAAPALGTVSSGNGNIILDKTYYNGSTETDNIDANSGDTITVRVKYDNTSDKTLIGASIKDSLPAGFNYVAGSAKNCLAPTTAEVVCDGGNATQKDSIFNNLTGANGVSPSAGLYDAVDIGANGTAFGANTGLLETGKKRYLNLQQCHYIDNFGSYSFVNNLNDSNFIATTGASNDLQAMTECFNFGSGYTPNSTFSGFQGLDLQNKKYFNLNQCTYNNGLFFYNGIINGVASSFYDTGTNTSNTSQTLNICGTGNTAQSQTMNINHSNVKTLELLGNRYVNLAKCLFNDSASRPYYIASLIDNIPFSQFSANTSTSNIPTTLSCGPGDSSLLPSSGNRIQNIDLLDKTRGNGYIEYQMTVPSTVGSFGTDVSLSGNNGAEIINVSDAGLANTISANNPATPPVISPSPATSLPKVSVTVNQNSTQSDPTVSGPVSYIATFSEPIDPGSLTPAKILLEGTAATKRVLSVTEIAPLNGTTFEILVNAATAGTIQVSIPKAKFLDFTDSSNPRPGFPTVDNDLGKDFAKDSSNNLYFFEPFIVIGNSNQNSRIIKMTPDGTTSVLATLDSSVNAITIDRFDNVYTLSSVSNTSGSQYKITKIIPTGFNFVLTATAGQDATSIVADSIGNIYANDTINSLITKTNITTGVTSTFAILDATPINLAIDSLDTIYATTNTGTTIKKIISNGTITSLIIRANANFFTNIIVTDIFIDRNNSVYTQSINSSGVRSIIRIDTNETITTFTINPFSQQFLFIDEYGNQYSKIGDIYDANIDLSNTIIYKITNDFFAGASEKLYFNDNSQLIKTTQQRFLGGGVVVPAAIAKQTPNFRQILKANIGRNYNFSDSTSTDNIVTLTQANIGIPQATVATPLNAFSGILVPNVNLISVSIVNGTPATLTLQGSSTAIVGQILGSAFVPDAGQIIPTDIPLGANNAVLNSSGLSVTVPLNILVPLIATITQADGQADPTTVNTPANQTISTPVKFKVEFNKPIDPSTFTKDKVSTLDTPANVVAVRQIAPNNDTTFEVDVTAFALGVIKIGISGAFIEGDRLFIDSTNFAQFVPVISPIDSVSDNLGNTYVLYDGNIKKIDSLGVVTTFVSFPNQDAKTAIISDNNNNLYVSNFIDKTIIKVTPAGLTSNFATISESPSDIVIDSTGNLLVLNTNATSTNITKVDASGTVSNFYTTNKKTVQSMAIDSLNNVYLSFDLGTERIDVNTTRNIGNIEKITPSGVSSIFIDNNYGSMFFDKSNTMYLIPRMGVSVPTLKKINTLGVETDFSSSPFAINKVVFSSTGDIFVASTGGPSIYKFLPSGQFELYKELGFFGVSPTLSNIVIDKNNNIIATTGYFSSSFPVGTTQNISKINNNQIFDASRNSYNIAKSVATDNQVTVERSTLDCPEAPQEQVKLDINIFSSIDVSAEVGPPPTTTSASACGVIYTPLEVAIDQATTQIDPTTTGPVKYTVVFNQAINTNTFAVDDIELTGTAPGLSIISIAEIAPNNGTTFEVTVNATGNGTVIANIPQKGTNDGIQAANIDTPVFNNSNSTSIDNIVTIFNNPNNSPTANNDNYSASSGISKVLTPLPVSNDTGNGITVQSINGVDLTPGISQNISLPKGSLNISSTGLYTFNSLNDEIGISNSPYVIKDSFNVTTTANITIDITDPCTLTQNGTTASACGVIYTQTTVTISVPYLTNNPKPSLNGTCVTENILSIAITPTNETINGLTCAISGTYSINPITNIPDGNYCAIVTAQDPEITINTANDQECGIVDTSTFVTIVVPALGTNNLPSFTGTCETGASLNLTITPTNERINGVTCVNETYSIPATVYIPTGNYCGSIVATDATGNTATASGCGDILVTVEVPITTEDTTPTISGSCTPSTSGGYQVPVEVTLRFGTGSDTGAGTLSEIINTTCSTQGTYTVTPTKDIPVGLYSATAKATSEIGNIAISTNSGTITTPQPENFSVITDPYQCGKSIIGKATSNYGINQITVNLFSKKTDNSGNYETTPKYTFNPVPDSNGNYEIKPDYTNEANFKQGEYKVEFSLKSNTSITKTDSYIANITDKCNPLALVTTTIRTGGLNTLVFAIIPILLALTYYGYGKTKKSK